MLCGKRAKTRLTLVLSGLCRVNRAELCLMRLLVAALMACLMICCSHSPLTCTSSLVLLVLLQLLSSPGWFSWSQTRAPRCCRLGSTSLRLSRRSGCLVRAWFNGVEPLNNLLPVIVRRLGRSALVVVPSRVEGTGVGPGVGGIASRVQGPCWRRHRRPNRHHATEG